MMKKLIFLISILIITSGCLTVNIDNSINGIDVNDSESLQDEIINYSNENETFEVTSDEKIYLWKAPIFKNRFTYNLYAIDFFNVTYFDLSFGNKAYRYTPEEIYSINQSSNELTYISIIYDDGTIKNFAPTYYNPVVVEDTAYYMNLSIESSNKEDFHKADYWALVALKYNNSEKVQLMRTWYLINLYEIDEALKCAEISKNDVECVEIADKFIEEIKKFQESL